MRTSDQIFGCATASAPSTRFMEAIFPPLRSAASPTAGGPRRRPHQRGPGHGRPPPAACRPPPPAAQPPCAAAPAALERQPALP
jgi:hypothetical protein